MVTSRRLNQGDTESLLPFGDAATVASAAAADAVAAAAAPGGVTAAIADAAAAAAPSDGSAAKHQHRAAAEPTAAGKKHRASAAPGHEAAARHHADTKTATTTTAAAATQAAEAAEESASSSKSWLPPRPMLVGQRGLPLLRPENTIESFRAARAAGATAFATDVRIAASHTPYLFRDNTFARMTDASRVFPAAASAPVDLFAWTDIAALNPGAWWIERDIYGTVSSIDVKTREAIAEQRIALLEDLISIAICEMSPILVSPFCPLCSLNAFDCGDSCPLLLFSLFKDAKAEELLWWTGGMREELRRSLPGAKLVTQIDPSFQDDPTKLTDIVSAPWTDLEASRVKSLADKGYHVHCSGAASPWQFSYLWCSGVHSVSSEDVGPLAAIEGPLYAIQWRHYIILVASLDLAAVICVLGFVGLLLWKRWTSPQIALN